METQDAFSVQVGSTSCPVWRSARNPVIFTAAAVASVSTAGSGRCYGGTYFQFSSSPLFPKEPLYTKEATMQSLIETPSHRGPGVPILFCTCFDRISTSTSVLLSSVVQPVHKVKHLWEIRNVGLHETTDASLKWNQVAHECHPHECLITVVKALKRLQLFQLGPSNQF